MRNGAAPCAANSGAFRQHDRFHDPQSLAYAHKRLVASGNARPTLSDATHIVGGGEEARDSGYGARFGEQACFFPYRRDPLVRMICPEVAWGRSGPPAAPLSSSLSVRVGGGVEGRATGVVRLRAGGPGAGGADRTRASAGGLAACAHRSGAGSGARVAPEDERCGCRPSLQRTPAPPSTPAIPRTFRARPRSRTSSGSAGTMRSARAGRSWTPYRDAAISGDSILAARCGIAFSCRAGARPGTIRGTDCLDRTPGTTARHQGLRARKQYNGVKIPVLPPAT